MSAVAGWLVALLLFPVAGAPFLFHRAFRSDGPAARIILAGATGAVAVSWTMNLAALAGWRWSLPLLVAAGCLECFALRFAIRASEAEDDPGSSGAAAPLSSVEKIAIGVSALAVLAGGIAAISASATSPDLLLFWGPKAQAFAAARTIDDDFLGEPFLRYLHTSYPPLVTNVYALASIAAGRFLWMGPVLTLPLLLAAIAAALPGVLARSVPRRDALVAAAAITASMGFLADVFDVAGNADMALLFYEILAVAILLGREGDRASGQILAGLLLAGAAAAKVEGLPFAAAAVLFFLIHRRPAGFRAIAAAACRLTLPAAVSLAAWFAYGRQRFLFRGYETYGPTFEVRFDRLGLVAAEIARALGHAGGGIAWLLPLAALLATRRGWDRAVYPVLVAAALGGFFVFTYLHGAPDPTLWIRWSAGRIFTVISALLILAVTAARGSPSENEAGRAPRRATGG